MARRLTDAELAEILRRQGHQVDFPVRKPREKLPGPSESQIQQAVVEWWKYACYGFQYRGETLSPWDLLGFPLQGVRTGRNGRRLQAEGMRKGTPDLLLAVSSQGYHGFWIEMKKPGGRLTPEQKEALDRFDRRGYKTMVCYSRDEAADAIRSYLHERND